MEFVIIAVLVGGFALLWDRIKGLERRIVELEADEFSRSHLPASKTESATSAIPAEPEPYDEPASIASAAAPQPEAVQQIETESAHKEDFAENAYAQAYEDEEAVEARPRFQFDFEDIFGRRLPIWAGAIALAISGIFLVRYSIEAGLITPRIRVLLSMIFGIALIGAAEAAYRFEAMVRDERVRQALAGAGLATMFGGFYLAGSGYGLIGAGTAFIGLAIVTAGAIGLSHRFGLPCAIVGLVGGFAAPVLVDSDGANIPLLALYLALVTGGLAWTGQRQGRSWLGLAAMVGGLIWGGLMIASGINSGSDIVALGVYLVVIGTVLPAFVGIGGRWSLPQLGAAAAATLQMAYLVDDGGYSLLTWGLYLLIGGALAYLGWQRPTLRAGSAVAAAIAVWLLAFWPDPDAGSFALVAGAAIAIFALVPLALQWRGKAALLEIIQLAVFPFALGIVTYATFGDPAIWEDGFFAEGHLALVMVGLAAIPAASFAMEWRRSETLAMAGSLIRLGSASLLALAALWLVTPSWLNCVAGALVAFGLVALLHLRQQDPLRITAWTATVTAIFLLLISASANGEIELLANGARETEVLQAVVRWAAVLAAVVGLRATLSDHPSANPASVLAAAIAYGLAAQFLPGSTLAWVAAAAAIAVVYWRKSDLPAWTTFLVIAVLWTLAPMGGWIIAGAEAMLGEPFLVAGAIPAPDLFRLIAPAAIASGLVAWLGEFTDRTTRWLPRGIAAFLITISVHSLYKGAWGVENLADFARLGLFERTVWQALLLGGAIAAMKLATSRIGQFLGAALLAASMAHFTWFTLVVHNPLWDAQHVGPWPIFNLVTLAYGTGLAGLIVVRSMPSVRLMRAARIAIDVAIMALLSIWAVTLLRQIFAGSLLNDLPIGANESLLISLLGIILALGFLWFGSRYQLRSWRVGSLVLMLGAVAKVFLIDAAGLDGLLRIASFMALGFSLIGIGWFYTRQLKQEKPAQEALPE